MRSNIADELKLTMPLWNVSLIGNIFTNNKCVVSADDKYLHLIDPRANCERTVFYSTIRNITRIFKRKCDKQVCLQYWLNNKPDSSNQWRENRTSTKQASHRCRLGAYYLLWLTICMHSCIDDALPVTSARTIFIFHRFVGSNCATQNLILQHSISSNCLDRAFRMWKYRSIVSRKRFGTAENYFVQILFNERMHASTVPGLEEKWQIRWI